MSRSTTTTLLTCATSTIIVITMFICGVIVGQVTPIAKADWYTTEDGLVLRRISDDIHAIAIELRAIREKINPPVAPAPITGRKISDRELEIVNRQPNDGTRARVCKDLGGIWNGDTRCR